MKKLVKTNAVMENLEKTNAVMENLEKFYEGRSFEDLPKAVQEILLSYYNDESGFNFTSRIRLDLNEISWDYAGAEGIIYQCFRILKYRGAKIERSWSYYVGTIWYDCSVQPFSGDTLEEVCQKIDVWLYDKDPALVGKKPFDT